MSHHIIHGPQVHTNFMNLSFDLIDLLLVLDPCIMYEGLEEDFATDFDLLSHLATSKQQLQRFFNANYIPRSRQCWLLHIPHKKSTLLQGIKKKIALSSMSLMNILSFLEKTLIHVSLLIGGEVAARNFLLHIDLSVIFSQFPVSHAFICYSACTS